MDALTNYVKWFRGQKKKDPNWHMDWVGRELVYSEFAYEAFNKTPITRTDLAGGMSYSEREDTIRHQNLDQWIFRWQNYGIWKKFKIDLLDWLELEYPLAEWLLKRAAHEEERRQREIEKAAAEAKERGEDPPAPPLDKDDIADSLLDFGDEE